jgi:PST family polysaccharide transporter
MQDQAIRGVAWSFLAYSCGKVVTVATTVVVARLLQPEDFGLFVLAAVVTGLLSVFRDLGISGAIVVVRNGDRPTLESAFALVLAGALAGAGLIVALAAASSAVLDQPALDTILYVLAPVVIFKAVAMLFDAMLQRHLRFQKRFVGNMTYALTVAVVAIPLAVLGAGVWALVISDAVASAVSAVWLGWATGLRLLPRFHRSRARGLLASGRAFLAQEVAAFVHQNTDFFAVGRQLGTTQLGYYTMAYNLGTLPSLAVSGPLAAVTTPLLARRHHEHGDVASIFLTSLRLQALATVGIGVILSAAAEPFTRVVLGETWLPMATALTVFGLWAIARSAQMTIASFLSSVGQAGMTAMVTGVNLAILVPGLFVAAHYGDIETVAWVMLGDMVLSTAALAVVVSRRSGIALSAQWRAVRSMAAAGAVAWVATWAVVTALGHRSGALVLAAAVGAGALAYLLTVHTAEPGLLRSAFEYAKRASRPASFNG